MNCNQSYASGCRCVKLYRKNLLCIPNLAIKGTCNEFNFMQIRNATLYIFRTFIRTCALIEGQERFAHTNTVSERENMTLRKTILNVCLSQVNRPLIGEKSFGRPHY